MSGTSLDGIDAALVELGPPPAGSRPGPPEWRLVAFETVPYDRSQREELHGAVAGGAAGELARAHARLGEWFAEAVLAVCRRAGLEPGEVDLVGSHGQTVWHEPPRDGARGATLQLGCPATIAERTGLPVVSDFRSRDMAAGGEGAPLVPWVDRLLFADRHSRVLQNIGGMANLSRVPPAGSDDEVVAFDTGPGNVLMDAATELATDGAHSYDRDGELAGRGRVDEALLAELLAHPYFHRPPPKSTGRELFGRSYVRALVEQRSPASGLEWADLLATLTALTARSIADAIRRWADPGYDGEVIVTGGGRRNPTLMAMLTRGLAPLPVRPGEVLGCPPAAKEAVAFAVLAWAHVHGRPANLPSATGATGPRVLGSLTPGRSVER
jgi:anhydro-N-acetylmuramic acid kinase